jgi:hypothetical protein
MSFSGVEILKLQFSRAIDQTFEQFLDSWSLAPLPERASEPDSGPFATELPVQTGN